MGVLRLEERVSRSGDGNVESRMADGDRDGAVASYEGRGYTEGR